VKADLKNRVSDFVSVLYAKRSAARGRARGEQQPFGLLLAHATWIAAEIPQACRRQAEELKRKARFFCPRARLVAILRMQNCCSPIQPGKKMRPNSGTIPAL
jgi:hypothetical protein